MLKINQRDARKFLVVQKDGCCGPCSLAACLFMLGCSNVLPSDVIRMTGGHRKLKRNGSDEHELSSAAESLGVKTRHVLMEKETDGPEFANIMRKHLRNGPALLLCMDLEHWIAALTIYRNKFVIYNPKDGRNISLMNQDEILELCWNRSNVASEPDQYFSILLCK